MDNSNEKAKFGEYTESGQATIIVLHCIRMASKLMAWQCATAYESWAEQERTGVTKCCDAIDAESANMKQRCVKRRKYMYK